MYRKISIAYLDLSYQKVKSSYQVVVVVVVIQISEIACVNDDTSQGSTEMKMRNVLCK